MARLRFVILQTILIAAIAALWLTGPLERALAADGDARWFVGGVLAIGWVGLGLIAIGRLTDAAKIQDILPVIAVLAMQAGILSALAVVGQALMSSGEPAKAIGAFLAAISTALYVSIAALASYLWLRVTLWLCHGQ